MVGFMKNVPPNETTEIHEELRRLRNERGFLQKSMKTSEDGWFVWFHRELRRWLVRFFKRKYFWCEIRFRKSSEGFIGS